MKNILVVSECPQRGTSTGLTGKFLERLSCLDKEEFQISLFDTSLYGNKHQGNDYPVHNYFNLPKGFISSLVRRLPGLRSRFASRLLLKRYTQILREGHYDGVILYQIPSLADSLTHIAHENGAKMIFVPWGSEVLRCEDDVRVRLMKAFAETDYVVGAKNSNTILAAMQTFHVPASKIKTVSNDLIGLRKIDELRNKLSRNEMIERLGLPYSDYNIVCGYNGYPGQRHKVIIDALFYNKKYLPVNYNLIFPISYGGSSNLRNELAEYCKEKGISASFITEYMTDEQMAYIHFVTDLFIEIQPTDNGNAFLIESLYAKNQIVTGSWLHYNQFEQYGIPYHLIDKPEDLPNKLHQILCKEIPKISIPNQLIDALTPVPESCITSFWNGLLSGL